ncbi:MAG: NAD+ synthase [Rickettsiales bacterium]
MSISSDLPCTAIAQIDFTVGDISGNRDKIIAAWNKASDDGAQIVIFPELCVTGYPPEDLILMPEFRTQAMKAVRDIAAATKDGAAVIIGSVLEEDGKIYNAALLLDSGNIVHVQRKIMLPNYGIFDEKRLFSTGNSHKIALWRDYKVGILICEDIWDQSFEKDLRDQGVDIIFVINASPFEVGKYERRIEVAKKVVSITGCSLLYVNLVGGQDDIVFDGGSFALNSKGEVTNSFPQFAEGIFTINNYMKLSSENTLPLNQRDDNWLIWQVMKLGLYDYVRKNGFSEVLLGLSGGIDSAVTAVLAADALGSDNVLGVLLPSPYNSKGSVDDAKVLADMIGIRTITVPISSAMRTFDEMLTPHFGRESWIEEAEIGGNLQARLRAVVLMGLSNSYGSLLLSTGNKSEIAVGYSTLYGDSCGAYNVLKDLYKTKVYELANWRNSVATAIPESVISKPPSAELKPEQKDTDNLPPYEILDDILEKYIEKAMSAAEIIAAGHEASTVEKILKLVRISEYKRRQSCPGVKISSMLFGRDRRYPITNKF